ncbi:MAG: ABC transporter ATP-binding protein [Actinomycetota bacterium]
MGAVQVLHVTKSYRAGVGRARVREMMPWPLDRAVARAFPRWWNRNAFDALSDVSVSIAKGTATGFVGHNGAGKTTLLRVIAGVTKPTSGQVAVTGRAAALIDALVGFHPDLTGRENALLLGAIHGFGRTEMEERIDRILEFAEIEDLADTQLKRYSAGMTARLGFATVAALDVEILLIDEVLAVGDAQFQRKCIDWLQQFRASGGTLLFVSHNLGLVRAMTERVVWLDHGRVMAEGSTVEVLSKYGAATERREAAAPATKRQARRAMMSRGFHRWGVGGARVAEVQFEEPPGNGGALEVSIRYEADEIARAVFCVGFVDDAGREIGATASRPLDLDGKHGEVRCLIRPLPLRSGVYYPFVAILSPDGAVRDRWRLDRAVVVDRDAGLLGEGFGPVEITSSWSSNGSRTNSDRVSEGRERSL